MKIWLPLRSSNNIIIAACAPGSCFYRDSTGNEVDLVLERGRNLALMEIRSGQTVTSQFFQRLDKVTKISGDRVRGGVVIYGGKGHQPRSDWQAWPVKDLGKIPGKLTDYFAD
ncbi:MAG: hypothetical protein ACQES8_04000 [Thermodesulfobacteriota bacterium]